MKSELVVCLILICVLGALYFSTIRPGEDWGGDFSQYVAHARNIAEGRAYAATQYRPLPAPLAISHMPPAYPPGFPLMLAPVYRVFGLNYRALKLTGEISLLLSAFLFYWIGRIRGLNPLFAAAAGLTWATC